jgi:uncharacterized membrane-anchored protein YhcB (DUF1043 family)
MFNRKKTGDLVIKPRLSPRAKLLVAAGGAVAIVAAAVWIYNYGLSMAGFERSTAAQTQGELEKEIARLGGENQELREALARAQRTLQMDQTAYQDLERSLKNSAQEIVKLREELNFYRNIISPVDKKAGLRIQSLYIESAGQSNLFRYKLVLVQALKHERTIYGSANFEITGIQAGAETVLKYPRPQDKAISVNLKYFQDIEGKFELPKNFKPRQIRVNVFTAGGGEALAETYAWPQA